MSIQKEDGHFSLTRKIMMPMRNGCSIAVAGQLVCVFVITAALGDENGKGDIDWEQEKAALLAVKHPEHGYNWWLPRDKVDGKIVHLTTDGLEMSDRQTHALGYFEHLQQLVIDGTKEWDGSSLTTLHQCKKLWYFYARNGAFSDAGMVQVARCPGITDLEIEGSQVTDASLVHIAKLKGLVYLYLKETKIKGSGLRHLAQLEDLAVLTLERLPITDDDIALLGRSPVASIDLRRTKVTDACVPHLLKLPNLYQIILTETAVTDEGLRQLAKGKSLKWIAVEGTKVTEACAKAVMAKRPKLRIQYQW